MANAKELRKQIGSIKNTQKITSAMEMVAASKMRKAQERMSRGRPYSDEIRSVIGHVAGAAESGKGVRRGLADFPEAHPGTRTEVERVGEGDDRGQWKGGGEVCHEVHGQGGSPSTDRGHCAALPWHGPEMREMSRPSQRG